jgi:hypothetical protein
MRSQPSMSIPVRRQLIAFKLGGKTLYDGLLAATFDSAAYKDARAKGWSKGQT